MKATCSVLLACLAASVAGQVQTVGGRIQMQVGGSAGCPHVARYIRESVAAAQSEYGHLLDIEFVVWGKTERVGGALVCQFGAADCWANRLYRCALDLLHGNQSAQVAYMSCEFSEPRPGYSGSYGCAAEAGLRLLDLDYCMSSLRGDELELPAEAAAAAPVAAFGFIPYTVFNGHIDLLSTRQASLRLSSLACFALADDPATGVSACKI